MTTFLRSKTLTASLSRDSRSTFDWIANPLYLARWYSPLSRFEPIRFIRDDRAQVLDLVVTLQGIEMTLALRVFANGGGSEIVLTLIQPQGLSDSAFHEQTRWAGSAIAELKKIKPDARTVMAPETPPAEGALSDSIISAETTILKLSTVPISGRKLFVGNLPFAWTEDQLRELFTVHGTITHVGIPRLRGRHGRSRGFGFVEMSTESEAQLAIEKLHDRLAGERKIIVRLARAQESKMEASPSATLAEHTPDTSPKTDTTVPESGNARETRPTARPRRNSLRNRRPAPARSPSSNNSSPRRGADRPDRPRRDSGISNSSGYEIYPRDSKGGFATEPTSRSAETPQAPPADASPYFDDTGDFENRGNRFPRNGRR